MTKKEMKQRSRDLLNSKKEGTLFYDDFLYDLLLKHPRASEKIGCGICGFTVKQEPVYKSYCFHVVRVDDSIEKFSYNECITNSSPIVDFRTSAREAIQWHMLRIRKKAGFPYQCPICLEWFGSKEDIELDHYPVQFKTLVDNYIEENNINLKTFDEYERSGYGIKFEKDRRKDFITWHFKNFKYRLLCKECHKKEGLR